jgi:hypothetical protein
MLMRLMVPATGLNDAGSRLVRLVVSAMRPERLRLSTRKADPEIRPSVGMQPPRRSPFSNVGPDENRLPQTGCQSRPLPHGCWPMVPCFHVYDKCRCRGDTLRLGWRETQADDLASPGETVLMPTQSESLAAVSGTSSKTLRLLHRRLHQLLHAMLILRGRESRRGHGRRGRKPSTRKLVLPPAVVPSDNGGRDSR